MAQHEPAALELDGKAAIVTGGGRGIGQGIALAFAREGARVLVAEIDEARAAATLALADREGLGGRMSLLRTDVTREADVEAAVAKAVERFGGLDCMVNCGGGALSMAPLLDMPVETFDATLALSLRSVFLGIKHAGQAMRTRGGGGVILSIASIAGQVGGAAPSAYSAAKAGVIQLSRMAAAELGADRIRVNTISPGTIYADGFASMGVTPAHMASIQPWPEAGAPADVAAAAVFLASDRCAYATGADFVVDGGLTARGAEILPRLFAMSRQTAED